MIQRHHLFIVSLKIPLSLFPSLGVRRLIYEIIKRQTMAEVTIKLGNIGVEPIDQGPTGPGTDRSESVLDF